MSQAPGLHLVVEGLFARLAYAALSSAETEEVLCSLWAGVMEDLDDDAARYRAAWVLEEELPSLCPFVVAVEGVCECFLLVGAELCDVIWQAVLQIVAVPQGTCSTADRAARWSGRGRAAVVVCWLGAMLTSCELVCGWTHGCTLHNSMLRGASRAVGCFQEAKHGYMLHLATHTIDGASLIHVVHRAWQLSSCHRSDEQTDASPGKSEP